MSSLTATVLEYYFEQRQDGNSKKTFLTILLDVDDRNGKEKPNDRVTISMLVTSKKRNVIKGEVIGFGASNERGYWNTNTISFPWYQKGLTLIDKTIHGTVLMKEDKEWVFELED